ncbi:HAD family phosphatase [Rheinheimera soli]|jgi:phosphoserine phosphatase|uniref:phosphoserine phosphatase n=1 Tax=Rheinheimera soli TaxID=443616 RepID=A0ABU1VUW1_9GAMM|nr:HAD family phosphatase [Rheinheimera soli]MDR7119208.1 HAD superfamily phosphoserine phosphatase-like hydrolase [Rheinheimera soli]
MKAYCFDLDGTLTRLELLPMIANEIGLHEEISALTEATIKGVIPFRKSFLLRCRLLNEISVSRVNEIVQEIPLYEAIVNFINANSQNCFVVTGNLDVWVLCLQKKIKARFYCSKASVKDNFIKSIDTVLEKSDAIDEIRRLGFEQIIAIGDGMGDVSMFEKADVGIAFGATHEPIQSLIEHSNYITFSETALCKLLNTL